MRRSDSLSPAPPPHCFGWRACIAAFPATCLAAGSPGFPGGPHAYMPCSIDPGGTSTPGLLGVSVLPSAVLTTSASTLRHLSGLTHTACTLPVYASQTPLPTPTQHSVPAGGQPLPGGTDYPLDHFERFLAFRHVMRSSFPGLIPAHQDPCPHGRARAPVMLAFSLS